MAYINKKTDRKTNEPKNFLDVRLGSFLEVGTLGVKLSREGDFVISGGGGAKIVARYIKSTFSGDQKWI
jgi:hypothetical protein